MLFYTVAQSTMTSIWLVFSSQTRGSGEPKPVLWGLGLVEKRVSQVCLPALIKANPEHLWDLDTIHQKVGECLLFTRSNQVLGKKLRKKAKWVILLPHRVVFLHPFFFFITPLRSLFKLFSWLLLLDNSMPQLYCIAVCCDSWMPQAIVMPQNFVSLKHWSHPYSLGVVKGVGTLPLRMYVTDLPCGLGSNQTLPGNHPWASFSSHSSLRPIMILADTELEVQGDWATALWNPKMTGQLFCEMPWQCERLTSPEKWHVSVKP